MTDDSSESPEASGAHSSNHNSTNHHGSNDGVHKAKDAKRVLACGTCRKRKLKCDSKRPKCSTCARLGHPCEYDEVRKKSGPKRGYVKSLEARLNQLESLLESNRGDEPRESATVTQNISKVQVEPRNIANSPTNIYNVGAPDLELGPAPHIHDNDVNLLSDMVMPEPVDFSWDMISLGIEEPLPTPDIMDELYQLYFAKVHPSIPMLHRLRFMTSLNLGPNSRPPVCLRYSMWALACAVSPKYGASAEQFYQKARKYLEKDEMQGHGESFITVAHAQAWTLVCCYEFKFMYFPRAWLSVGRATRLVQMMCLHRQDRVGLDVKQTLPPPRDWTEREERRRTFWTVFCQDRYASSGTGWPMQIDEQDILTNLPASDEAFISGNPEKTPTLNEVLRGESISSISAYASVALLATLFGRNLTHLHRPGENDNDHDLSGDFWKRHRALDNIILNTSLSLPGHLRLPQGLDDPKVVFANMNIHTATICLHQAAIFKADKHKLAAQISSESKRRCLVAADQIASLMRMICHQDLTGMNPFSAFCLYVAARVFVQYLKFKKEDHTVRSSLVFLLQAMHALKKHNPLTESFLVQLDVDLEGSGIDIPQSVPQTGKMVGEVPANFDTVKCMPLFEIRQSQSMPLPQREFGDQPLPQSKTPSMYNGDLDQNPYFTTHDFDNGAPNLINNGLNELTPPFSNGGGNSRPHSNHHTPSSSSNNLAAPHSPPATFSARTSRDSLFSAPGHSHPMGILPHGLGLSPDPEEQSSIPMQQSMDQQNMMGIDLEQFSTNGSGLTPNSSATNVGLGMPDFAITSPGGWQTMNVDQNGTWMFS